MTYEDQRRDEHCTLGDAKARFQRDPDAFTAGAQYALDSMSGASTAWPADAICTWVDAHAERILHRVHTGRL